jgi:hypothetical protein
MKKQKEEEDGETISSINMHVFLFRFSDPPRMIAMTSSSLIGFESEYYPTLVIWKSCRRSKDASPWRRW